MENQERIPCPYCREMILPDAIKCKECGSTIRRPRPATGEGLTWSRDLPERKLFGVAACLARHFHISVTAVRLLFMLATLVHLTGLLAYVVLVLVIPYEPNSRSWFDKVVDSLSSAFENFRRPAPAPSPSVPPSQSPTVEPEKPENPQVTE